MPPPLAPRPFHRRVPLRPLPFLVMLLGGMWLARAEEPAPAAGDSPAKVVTANPKLKGYDKDGGATKTVYEIPIDGDIELGLSAFVERAMKEVKAGDIVVLKIKTFGGRVDAAVQIRDLLLDTKATTVAYIDHRAISAGALISLACDTIIMSPGSAIGAATPVQMEGEETKDTSEKVVSYMRAEMRATAEAKKRRADLAEAMVDKDIEIKGVIDKGKLLTLTGDKAVELGLADALANTHDDIYTLLNLTQAKRVTLDSNWGEKVARMLTNPVVSSMLMTFGFLGLLMELYTPGFGFPGVVGLSCLGLFFFGQYAASLAGFEEMLLFGIGVILLGLEIFVIPGFGVAGITGILAVFASLIMALIEVDMPLDVSFDLGYVQQDVEMAIIRLAITIAILIVAGIVLAKLLPRSPIASWLVFAVKPGQAGATSLGAESPGPSLTEGYDDLLGKRGVVYTVLRPTGVVDFNGRRVHVLTEGDYIDKGITVEVYEVDGTRVVVRRVATN